MNRETSGEKCPQRLLVSGWHKDRSTEISVGGSNDVACARRIIAAETAVIEARCNDIEAELSKNNQHVEAFHASKTRPQFDLEISLLDNGRPLGEWRERYRQEHAAAVLLEVPEEKSVTDWLVERYIAGGVFAAIGSIEGIDSTFLAKGGYGIEEKLPGEGAAVVCNSGNPQRTRPQEGSLAHWLSLTQQEARSKYIGFILGKEAGALDCALLRRRLNRHQIVCVQPRSEAAKALLEQWDGEVYKWPDLLVFARPGVCFLDPVFYTPEEIASIKWPKISVITVSFNQGQFLEECLKSVLDQDYPNLEYIVVDAVSTDGSVELLKRYEDRLSKLVVEPDEGQSDGLNKGLGLATGDILTWVNSDDKLAPGALRRGALAMLDFNSDLVTGGCRRITEKPGEILYDHQPAIPYGQAVPLGFIEHFMWTMSWEKGDYFFQPEVLFSAEAWKRSGGYLKLHLYWAMDWELWIRMALAGATISHIPEFVGCSREHPDQKTTSDQKYLYQLINILLEYDDAFAAFPAGLAPPASDAKQPDWLKLATLEPKRAGSALRPSQGQGRVKNVVKRIWRLRDPAKLRKAVRARVPDGVIRYLRRQREQRRFRYSGYTVIHRGRLAELRQSQRMLEQAAGWRHKIEQIKAETDRAYGIIAEFAMNFLFGHSETDFRAKEIIKGRLANGDSLYDALRDVSVHFYERQSRPSFPKARGFLKAPIDLPSTIGAGLEAGAFTIIDVGAEPLAFEEHVYAELLKRRPSLVIGFDPMDEDAPRSVHQDSKDGLPASEVRIFPNFILDGEPAVFHLARMQATSSTLPFNKELTQRFSLLADALETMDRQDVETYRLDDIMEEQGLGERNIDFLKIDVQGATLPVLKGAGRTLERTLVCHLEAEFAELYKSEALFSEIDRHMRAAGFALLDLSTIGRQRYAAFDSCRERFYHTGRILWADCVYVRHLDDPAKLSDAELLKLAEIAHLVYQQYDVAAFALQQISIRSGSNLYQHYLGLWG